MALERREILFSLAEIKDALLAIDTGDRSIPLTYDLNLIEAVHTRDIHRQFHVVRDRYGKIYKEHLGKDGMMFRAAHRGARGFDQYYEFFIPDDTMIRAIIFACKKAKIMTPRSANKRVIAEDIFIGVKFEIAQAALVLEDA
ncbi:MAG TPA: hypothetical protein VGD95_06420 [Micavibrio sp.]